jgi:excisionase family DNA binding protein
MGYMSAYEEEIQAIFNKPTCTVEELAKVLGIGRRQAYEAVNRGDVPSIRIGGRILIPTRKLRELLGDES